MGNMILAAASTKTSSSSLLPILIIVVLFALLYFVMIRPQRNRQRRAMQMQGGVQPGSRVRTTAGIYGTVVAVQDADVILEIAPGVNITIMRRAIMDVVPDGSPAGAPSAAGGAGTASANGAGVAEPQASTSTDEAGSQQHEQF
jgi:preprotein translocase subunit YajC